MRSEDGSEQTPGRLAYERFRREASDCESVTGALVDWELLHPETRAEWQEHARDWVESDLS